MLGRLRAIQVPPHDAGIRSRSSKLNRKGKVGVNNRTPVRNKWVVISLEKCNKPSAKIKSIIRGDNHKLNPNKEKLMGEKEKYPEREVSDDQDNPSRSKSAKGEGFFQSSD